MSNVNAPYGSTLIAILVYAFLYGLATLQTLLFFRWNDRLHLANKIAVTVLWVMAGLNLAFISHFVYYYLILTEADSANNKMPWSFIAYSAVDFLLLSFSQMLYTARLWQVLSRLDSRLLRHLLCSILAILLTASVALAIFLPFSMARASTAEAYTDHLFALILFALVNGTFIDFVLSCALIYALIKAAGKNYGWTDSSMVVLMSYAVNTGAIATLFSLGAVLGYAVNQFNLTFLAFKIVHVGVYFNSFLAMMNSRFYFQQHPPFDGQPQIQNRIVSYETSTGDLYTRQHLSPAPSFNSGKECTINEVGLPLFSNPKTKKTSITSTDEMKMVEIRVEQEKKQAYHQRTRPASHHFGTFPR
ncbi:hypothetical protein L218DRAFT_1077419 [Marasmius fiardii PR-910]|nr:hypothetical protein L218DRAFT_1077419 [Marasmius fiardii PR-910]